jgi:hypothetical protein
MDRTSPLPHLSLPLLVSALATLASWPASAVTTLYRCGETYQQMPCAGGTAMRIVDDRTSDQKSQADSLQHDEMRLAQSLRQQRLARERQAAKSAPPISAVGPVSPTRSDKTATAKAHHDDCSTRKSGKHSSVKPMCEDDADAAGKSRHASAHQANSEQTRAQQPLASSELKSAR